MYKKSTFFTLFFYLVIENFETAAWRDLADGGGVETVVVVAVPTTQNNKIKKHAHYREAAKLKNKSFLNGSAI